MHPSRDIIRITGLMCAALLWTAASCSFTDGEPWGTVQVSVSSSTPSPDFIGSTDVTLGAAPAPLEVELVRVSSSGTGGGGEFDPSDPPAGYTLCHGGHCHAESGELVPYEEVRAQMQGGGDTTEISLAAASTDIDLSAPFTATVGPLPIPSRGAISEVHLHSDNVVLNGELQRDASSVPMTVRLGPVSLGHLDLEGVAVGPDSPESRSLDICANWPDPLFADIDLAELTTQDGEILITKIVNADAAQSIIDAIENANWTTCN